MPVFSLIVPIYNTRIYLKKCLDSIKHQTFNDFEAILIDDGSTDDSALFCQEYIKNDKRFVFFSKTNGGLSSARNFGIDKAEGSFLIFIDSDDFLLPDYLENFFNILSIKNYDADILVGGNSLFINGIVKKNKLYFKTKKTLNFDDFFKYMLGPSPYSNKDFVKMSVWGNCYNRRLFVNYNLKFKSERIYVSEDIVLHADLLYKSIECFLCDNYSYVYLTSRNNSLTKKFSYDRFFKEINLFHYLDDKIRYYEGENLKNSKSRLSRMFIDRFDAIIGNLICNNSLSPNDEIFNIEELKKCLSYINFFRIKSIKFFIRYVLYRCKLNNLLFFVHKLIKR